MLGNDNLKDKPRHFDTGEAEPRGYVVVTGGALDRVRTEGGRYGHEIDASGENDDRQILYIPLVLCIVII